MLFSGLAMAQGFMPWTDVMLMADSNKDGKLSMKEVKGFSAAEHFVGFQPFMADHFADCDVDNDDSVTMFELKSCMKSLGMTDPEASQMFFKGVGFMPRNHQ